MNFYDFMRLIIAKGSFVEGQQNDLLALVEYLEHMNAFGAVVQQKVTVHEHIYQSLGRAGMRVCRDCGIPETRQW